MVNSPNANFHSIQDAFNTEWDGKEYEKGKGYKQFKRWEYFMESRVSANGEWQNSGAVWTEMNAYRQTHPIDARTAPLSSWRPLGPASWTSGSGWNPGIGRVNCVEIDPTDENTIYIGTPAGGCWKSIDAGNNWIPLTDNQPILGVSAIAINYTNPDIIYIGTGDDDGGDTYSIGVLKSIDGGVTWNTTGLSFSNTSYRIYDLAMDPNNPDKIYAGTNGGFYSTNDGGDSWTLSIPGTCYDIEIKPDDPNTIYICNSSVWKSTDGGASFSSASSGLPDGATVNRALIAVSAAEPDYLYYLCGNESDNSFKGVYRSDDAGTTWELRGDSPNIFSYETDGSGSGGQSWYDMALTASPTNGEEIYIGGINVWKSNTGGNSFEITSHWVHPTNVGYTHADIHVLEAFGDKIYCGSDGGIFATTDGAANWVDITFGLEISQFYGFGSSETNPDLIIAGAQDNGTNLWSNDDWKHVIGADGMEALIDWANPQIMYGSIQNGSLQKSTNGGGNFNGIAGQMTDVETGNWVTPFEIDPVDHNTLYAGYNNVWKTTDGGNFWFTISNFTSGSLDQIAVAENNNNFIYTSVNSILYKTYNGGTNWSTISSGLPGYDITDVTIDNDNCNRVWVTLSGYGDGEKIYQTNDGGNSWTNISGSLPNLPANCVAAENGPYNGIYVGMDAGIYYTNDTISDWIPFFDNLPNVIISELEINESSKKVRGATYGRGIWESNLYNTPLLTEEQTVNSLNHNTFFENEFIIYPNPTQDIFFVKSNRSLLGQTMELFDYTGKLILSKKIDELLDKVSLTELPAGIYLMRINNQQVRIIKG